jgi:CRP-like cAMP-binding protein
MQHAIALGNRLLAALPKADLESLGPLRKVPLERDAVLVHSGYPAERIHFPCSGMISFMMEMPNGQAAATSVAGNDGVSGMLLSLGPASSPITAVVRLPGTAWQISPAQFNAALRRRSAIRVMVLTFARTLLVQLQHVAVCNALHSVEQRMAAWLLRMHDRVEGDVVPVTQDAIAELLGVRRTTVTLAALKLKEAGAIRSHGRGSIEIDRKRLEAASCQCYKLMSHRIDGIASQHRIKTSHHHATSSRADWFG